MASSNESIVVDPESLAQDDLVELYHKLASNYKKVKEDNDDLKQQLHSSAQNLRILANSQNDLQSELETLNSLHQAELREAEIKNSAAIESLKLIKLELELDKTHLESRIDGLTADLESRQQEFDELRASLANQKPKPRISDSFSINLEVEIESLQEMLKDLRAKLEEADEKSHQKDEMMEQLTEKILCLEDNLDTKRSELEEKNEALEGLQEKVQTLELELMMLKSAPEDANRKGNSLFAELDDQRQVLKRLLQGERDHYLASRKALNSKEIEIRRLKRENHNVRTEIQTCSNLMQRGDKIAIETLSAHVVQLQNDNKRLERVLAETEKKLLDLAHEQNLDWIESLMSSGTFEHRDLRDKLMKVMMEKTSLADNCNKNMRELAKARLDCVKLKILLGRIVDSNGIKINVNDYKDIGVDTEILENLKIEELEEEEIREPPAMFDGGEINESTIFLLGGRQRLGAAVPSDNGGTRSLDTSCEGFVNISDVNNSASGENNEERENSYKLRLPTFKQDQKPSSTSSQPLKEIKVDNNVSKEKSTEESAEDEKHVKFNSVVETKVIDSNLEQFEKSNLARKRNPIVIKRIMIPSKSKAT